MGEAAKRNRQVKYGQCQGRRQGARDDDEGQEEIKLDRLGEQLHRTRERLLPETWASKERRVSELPHRVLACSQPSWRLRCLHDQYQRKASGSDSLELVMVSGNHGFNSAFQLSIV